MYARSAARTAPYAYEAVTAVFTCGGYTFTAKGRTTLCEGWREIEKLSRAASEEQDEDAEPETVLPPLTEGQTFDNPAAEISERYTQPPKAYTEDTLLSAMENAGKEETPEDAERKGLGTTATRAGIIEKLISAGFAERKGKKLIPTKDGYNLAAIPARKPYVPAAYGRMGNPPYRDCKGQRQPRRLHARD